MFVSRLLLFSFIKSLVLFFFFFFFQAEDGIRDLIVTGVQTCALPISWRGGSDRGKAARASPGQCPPPPRRRVGSRASPRRRWFPASGRTDGRRTGGSSRPLLGTAHRTPTPSLPRTT